MIIILRFDAEDARGAVHVVDRLLGAAANSVGGAQ